MFAKLTLGTLAFFASVSALAAPNKTLVLVNDPYPPYVMPAGDKIGPGIDIEIAKEALSRGGYQVEVKLVPFKRVMVMLENGEADFTTTLSFKPERDKFLDWSSSYRDETIYHFYVAKGKTWPATTLADFKGKRLGVTAGFSYPKAIENS